MTRFLMFAGILFASQGIAQAETSCFLAGGEYSHGVRLAGKQCSEGIWRNTDPDTNEGMCLFAGGLYTPGAVISRNQTRITCQINGKWK